MQPPAAILLDKDGVLVDFHRTWLPAIKRVALAVAREDAALAERLLVAVGYVPRRDTFLPGSIWAAGTQDELIDHWHGMLPALPRSFIAEQVHGILGATEPQPAVPLHELQALLATARENGCKLAIVTNDATDSARRTAALFGIDGLLDAIIGADCCARPKPYPDLVHEAEHRLALPADGMAMVGDNVHDGEMARAAGCGWFIGVESGTSGHDDLAPLADTVLPDVNAALRWLLRGARARPLAAGSV